MLHRFAFLPLISDPEGRDKSRLFHDLESETEVELAADNPHPPIFACVMRRQGSQKQLECHGFVCNTSEDAIIIAANLYQVRIMKCIFDFDILFIPLAKFSIIKYIDFKRTLDLTNLGLSDQILNTTMNILLFKAGFSYFGLYGLYRP